MPSSRKRTTNCKKSTNKRHKIHRPQENCTACGSRPRRIRVAPLRQLGDADYENFAEVLIAAAGILPEASPVPVAFEVGSKIAPLLVAAQKPDDVHLTITGSTLAQRDFMAAIEWVSEAGPLPTADGRMYLALLNVAATFGGAGTPEVHQIYKFVPDTPYNRVLWELQKDMSNLGVSSHDPESLR